MWICRHSTFNLCLESAHFMWGANVLGCGPESTATIQYCCNTKGTVATENKHDPLFQQNHIFAKTSCHVGQSWPNLSLCQLSGHYYLTSNIIYGSINWSVSLLIFHSLCTKGNFISTVHWQNAVFMLNSSRHILICAASSSSPWCACTWANIV